MRPTATFAVRSGCCAAKRSRYAAICAAWATANGSPVSSVFRVEQCSSRPLSAVRSAVPRLPPPHQTRSSRPGLCGCSVSSVSAGMLS